MFEDVDEYSLQGFAIAATELCVDGDQLRTEKPLTITQTETDYSQCDVYEWDGNVFEDCPPSAHVEVGLYQGYLASPLIFSEKECTRYEDDDQEVDSDEGGYLEDEKCVEWEIRTIRLPLQYTIRYMTTVDEGESEVDVELYRVKKSIPPCKEHVGRR